MELEYHLAGGTDADWFTQAELESNGYTLADTEGKPRWRTGAASQTSDTASGKPVYWDASPYKVTTWPPKKLDKDMESSTYGQMIPDTGKIERYYAWEERYLEKQAEAKQKQIDAQAKVAKARTDAQAKLDHERFQWQNTITDNQLAAQRFEYQQHQDAIARQPQSLEALMAKEVASGNLDGAYLVRDLIHAPTPFQFLQLALQYSDNPGALRLLYDFFTGTRNSPFGQAVSNLNPENPFPAGSYAARSFDALSGSQQQQYNLRQQWLKITGGVLPGQAGTASPLQTPSPAATQPSPFNATNEAEAAGGFTPNPGAYTPNEQARQDFFTAVQAKGTPISRTESPYQFMTDAELQAILDDMGQAANWQAVQAEKDRRATPVADFGAFMTGGPDIGGKLTPEEAANRAAGNPYQGKILATNPLTFKWDTWVDDPNFAGVNPLNGMPIGKPRTDVSQNNPFGASFDDFLAMVRKIRPPVSIPAINPFAQSYGRA